MRRRKDRGQLFRGDPSRKRLSNADIRIVPSDYGTSPLNIVEYAIDLFNETRAFDRVYVVFDRDDHLSYHNALAKAEATDKS